ncbi:hypothetical protein [Flavobacterium frigoris]|uniref:Uncharacterized protein n=1 Tax=Flavobacterium frigoris TaxID=229204 RepID=A0A1H9CIA4_FLAFI|nr:hypothetical protein [Flavobacterium frigoris]SEQ00747.1 hypothetical protein SAMN05444355_101178 [Flavobacterium frigoris]
MKIALVFEKKTSNHGVYTDMAWGGLVKTPIYNKKIPLGSAERARIENRYQAESLNRAVGQGTPSVQNPIGNPCN